MLTSDRVVVFAPNWLGDAVMALPAIADIRRHFPSARLVVFARPSVASLFELVPGVDDVVTADPRGTIAILLPNSFGSARLARRAGFAERWGYATDWRRRLLTRSVPVPRESMHQGRYYQHLISELGIPAGPLEPRVDVPPALMDQSRARLTVEGWDGKQPLVTMAPGAAYGTAKRWPPKHFATVVAALARQHGVRTALVGSAADAETIRMIVGEGDARDARPIDLAGRTSLQELAGVIGVSAACVSNDSGAMHLAAAIGIPIVALFGPTRDTETAPLIPAGGHREVLSNPVWCRPCMLRECPIDHRCMKGLRPERVLTALGAALGRRGTAEPIRHASR